MSDASQESEIRFDDEADREATPPTCAVCKTPIATEYYMANEAIVCTDCRQTIEIESHQGSAVSRFVSALGLGLVAAAVGAGIYFAILALTGYEIGLVAIVVGFLVGGAVRIGSKGRGGWAYQTLALVLTYFAIVTTYIPFILQAFQEQSNAESATADSALVALADSLGVDVESDSMQLALNINDPATEDFANGDGPVTLGAFALAWVVLFLFAAASPVLAGLQNIIGMLIIGFALYQAWTMNRRKHLTFTGPFAVSAEPASHPSG